VYNCAGLPYANDYPELADDPARVARDLDELDRDGLVPVVVATDDRRGGPLARSFVANGARVRVCFPMWEMNGILRNDLAAMQACILATRAAAPQADCYVHFTPGHGSISEETGRLALVSGSRHGGTAGAKLEQVPAGRSGSGGRGQFDRDSTGRPRRSRRSGPVAGLHQLTVKFEYGVFDVYHGRVANSSSAYTATFLGFTSHVAGFCDGGPSPNRQSAGTAAVVSLARAVPNRYSRAESTRRT
jgi:hypothetical protein